MARHRRQGGARRGAARPGKASQARRGTARRGPARPGTAGIAKTGLERPGYKYPLHIFNQTKYMTATTTKKESAASVIRKLAEKHGSITAEIVLIEAKKKTSPLHSHFQWDDTKAARQFRLIQAAALIRKIKVEYIVSEINTVRVRAFHNVTEDVEEPETGVFVSLQTALSVDSYRDQLLAQCKRDIQAFKSKYSALSEVSHIINAMDHVA
jgi:hypothetical protein